MKKQTKQCTKCKTVKSVDMFTLRTSASGKKSFNSWCKPCNSEHSLIWQRANKKATAELHRKYELTHREHLNKYRQEYQKIPQNRLRHNHLVELRNVLIGERSGTNFVKKLGLRTVARLRKHIESTIPEGYTWADYGGTRIDSLQIDHIIPISAFNLTYASHRKKCFHYTNLRLITREENQRKGSSIIKQVF